jgi:hypothetical protein
MTVTFLALAVLSQATSGGEAPWPTFTSASGFSVAMPGTPVEKKQTTNGPNGPIENITVMVNHGKTLYMATRIINPAPISGGKEAEYFRELHTALAKTSKVISDKAITLAGHPGRDFTLEIPGQGGVTIVTLCRSVLMSPDVTFNLQVIRSKTDPAPRDRDVAAFFESLKLVPAKAGAAAGGSKLAFKPFAPPDAGFSLMMPGKPDESTTRQSSEKGSFTVRNFQCETPLGLFAVSVLEYGPEVGNAPAATKAEMLSRMCEALAATDKGQIVHQSSGLFEGFPARIVRYTFTPPGTKTTRLGETRAIMAGRKVILLSVRAPQDRLDPADGETVFNSFHRDQPAAAPGAMARRGQPEPDVADADPAPAPSRARRAAPAARAPLPKRVTWKRFNSAVGGFTVLMPGEPAPNHEEHGLLGAKGVDVFIAESGQARYVVQYQDMTRTTMKKGAGAILKAARHSDEKVVQGKVVGEKEATLKGAIGVSYQIESPDPNGPVARVRAYMVGARLYQVIVVAPKTEFPTDDSERFFRSFRLQGRN